MFYTKEIKKLHLENRINKMNSDPVANSNLINKARRQLNKLNKSGN